MSHKQLEDVPPWDTYYERADGTTTASYADGLDGVEPATPVGESIDLRFVFRASASSVTDDFQERYEEHLEICRGAAGEYELFEGDRRTLFTETNPTTAPSPILGVEPTYITPTTVGLWTLIDGVEPETRFPEEVCVLTVSVTAIASMRDYASIPELRTALAYSAF